MLYEVITSLPGEVEKDKNVTEEFLIKEYFKADDFTYESKRSQQNR